MSIQQLRRPRGYPFLSHLQSASARGRRLEYLLKILEASGRVPRPGWCGNFHLQHGFPRDVHNVPGVDLSKRPQPDTGAEKVAENEGGARDSSEVSGNVTSWATALKCNICGFVFKERPAMRMHAAIAHRDILEDRKRLRVGPVSPALGSAGVGERDVRKQVEDQRECQDEDLTDQSWCQSEEEGKPHRSKTHFGMTESASLAS